MPQPRRFYVRSPDGKAMFGFDQREAAETVALEYGDGAYIVDTLAQAYYPMLQEVSGGEVVYAGFGGWDTGRLGADRNMIEGIKKGHVAIVQAFLEKGADADARDGNGGPALIWAAATGKADIVALLLARGADVDAADAEGTRAIDVAARRGKGKIVELLRMAGAAEPAG